MGQDGSVYQPIVRFLAPHVRNTVDEEGDVQGDTKSGVEVHPKGIPNSLVPIVDGNVHWQENDEDEEKERV